MGRRVMIGVSLLAGLMVMAGFWTSWMPMVSAADNASLADIVAGCEGFRLTATFDGTVDEEGGFDYVQLRVYDAAGALIYTAVPWGAISGQTETVDFAAGYAQMPQAGPLLFVLEDIDRLVGRRLPSIASAIAPVWCDSLPSAPPVASTAQCAVRLRTGPGLNYRWRRFLEPGMAFTAVGRLFDSSWLQVRLDESGMVGWVYDGRCLPGSPEEGTYAHLPVTFFRTADEVMRYEYHLP